MLRLRLSCSLLAACIALGCSSSERPPAVAAANPVDAVQRTDPASDGLDSTDRGARECQLYCGAPRMVPRVVPEPDYTQREIDDATTVMASMTDDLLACYKKRLRVNPKAHAFITVDVLVGSDGRVRKVDTTGGAILGNQTMACVVHRIEQGVFEPPHGGGNIHVQMPFSLRVVSDDDET